jgi:hypothetical protein
MLFLITLLLYVTLINCNESRVELTKQMVDFVTVRGEESTAALADLIRRGGSGKAVIEKGGESLLHLACIYDNPEKVKLLLQAGADPNYRANRDIHLLEMTALSWCVYGGYTASVEAIVMDSRTHVNMVFYTEDGSFVTATDIALKLAKERDGKIVSTLRKAGGLTFQELLDQYSNSKGSDQDVQSVKKNMNSIPDMPKFSNRPTYFEEEEEDGEDEEL